MIKIIHGSIFDHKCDLLVVPCSSGGSVTPFVLRELQKSQLPTEIGGVPYGSVHFQSVKYENASILAYAASVNGNTQSSEPPAIRNIAKEIVSFSIKNQISLVNVPLIGTGAGGLSPGQVFAELRTQFERDHSTTYVIYCLSEEVYRNLAVLVGPEEEENDTEHPRVFISYAGNDKVNASWVKQLATKLRENGVDARLDQFHLKPGEDLPQWMTDEVIKAEKILLICDSYYMEKANFRKGGVGWETMVIQGDMLAQGDNKHKYIAIIREEKYEKALPIYMRSKYALNFSKKEQLNDQLFNDLLLHLYDRAIEPPLGKTPAFILHSKRAAKH